MIQGSTHERYLPSKEGGKEAIIEGAATNQQGWQEVITDQEGGLEATAAPEDGKRPPPTKKEGERPPPLKGHC